MAKFEVHGYLSVCETQNGDPEPFLSYMESMRLKGSLEKAVEIEFVNSGASGKSCTICIPVNQWSEFVRLCQRLSLSGGG